MKHSFEGKNIGIAMTGSYCTYKKTFEAIRQLKNTGANLIPIFSFNAASTDSRFGTHDDFLQLARDLTGKEPILTIPDAEPIGPKSMLDILVIAPCTGNTMAKLQQGIVDTTVLMAAKAHLRNEKPLVLAISTNDALSMNLRNIGLLMNMKHIYFVPFRQDDYQKKPHSLVADFSRLEETIAAAMKEKQLQPVVLSPMPVDYK